MLKSVSQQLVDRCLRPVAPELRERAVLHTIDWLACAAIGSSAPSAPVLWCATELPNCSDKSSLSDDPWRQLLYEASRGNLFEMDDVHRTALVHPGSVVVPSTLFMARRLGANGSDILTAIVRGYEAMIRFGMGVGETHYDLRHNTATCGVLGAAAAACSLLQLNESDWVNAFGHAVTQAAGLDRKSTRLNSSHVAISYAVFCL